jgi:hypothetical protein
MPRQKEWGAVNEIVSADKLLVRAREIAEGLAKLPPLTTRYTRIALTQKLRRIIDEGIGYGLALEGISAADVARAKKSRTPIPGSGDAGTGYDSTFRKARGENSSIKRTRK